jgi:hypothetical protein
MILFDMYGPILRRTVNKGFINLSNGRETGDQFRLGFCFASGFVSPRVLFRLYADYR